MRKIGSKILILVWDNSFTYFCNNAKEFYLKKESSSMMIFRFKSYWKYLDIVKNELDKRKINKRVEIIKTVQKFLNELDQDIIRNCVDSTIERILKLIEVKEYKVKY